MQRGLAGLQKRAKDGRTQKGVKYGTEMGPVAEGVENISREPVSMPSTLGEQNGELYYVMMN